MIQAGDGLCFALEPLAQFSTASEMSRKNLDGDNSIEARVARTVHFSHSARTDG